ncbi:MAG: DUF1559 domain-containing protein, partial [Planctomycetota bacterium]
FNCAEALVADEAEREIIQGLEDPSGAGLTTSYVACYGDGTYLQAEQDEEGAEVEQRRRAGNRGMFAAARQLRFRDILDGLSNTLMYSEVVASRTRMPGKSEIVRGVRGLSKNPSLCLKAASDPNAQFWPFGRGAIWADGYLSIGGFQTVLPPNAPSCSSDLGLDDSIVSASSSHAGGVMVLFGDGAVKFISDTIDTGDLESPGVSIGQGYLKPGSQSPFGLWGALGSRASREVINELAGEPVQFPRRVGGRPMQGATTWRSSDGKLALKAEFVRIIDEETVELRSAAGNLHHVPLNELADQDIFRAVKTWKMKQNFDQPNL